MRKYYAWGLSIALGCSVTWALEKPAAPGGLDPAARAGLPEPSIVERGAHFRKWKYVTSSLGQDGRTVLKTNRYTELATGLNVWRAGQWVTSSEAIDLVPGGAMASQGSHQVGFAANINTLGAINLLTKDGLRLRSHVLGLAYTDAKSGQSVLIAGTQDSIGVIVGENQVLYRDAFDHASAVQADVRYTYTRAGLEQDIILRVNPPGPELFGLDPATTRLEVFTEFVEAPQPTVTGRVVLDQARPESRAGMVIPDFVSEALSFGDMRMDEGQAFPLQDEFDPEQAVPTGKTWEVREGRTFLIEAVQYPAVQRQLEALEKKAEDKRAAAPKKAGAGRSFPAPPAQARLSEGNMRMAAVLDPKQGGLVIDYNLVTSGVTNFVFQADTTYYVGSSTFFLYGTTVIEGGTVIKLTNGTVTSQVRFMNAIDCRTSPYRPAIFTSMHDNTVGDTIANSTANPTNYCGYMVYLAASAGSYFNLHDLHVSHAWRAFHGLTKVQADISHCQVYHTQYAFYNNTAIWNLRNILVNRVENAFNGYAPSTNNAEHLTFHSVINFRSSGLPAVNLTNSLLIGVTNLVSYVGTGVETNLSDAGLFQTVGAGAHYLADNSPYRDVGTTNINPALLADLKRRTTYPPTIIAPAGAYYGVSQTLFPCAGRDSDTPDLGYHYDPIDYAVSFIYLTNATIQVDPGTVLAVFNPTNTLSYGLALGDGAKFLASGRADSKITITHYSTVQEMANTNWNGPLVGLLYPWDTPAGTPEFRCRFTDFSVLAGGCPLISGGNDGTPWRMTDCQFHGGSLQNYSLQMYFTNCLFNRNYTYFWGDASTNHQFRNCTFQGGTFTGLFSAATDAWMTDTLLAGTTISANPTNSNICYTTNCNGRLDTTNLNDVVLASLSFQPGPLGYFYIPTNSALLDAGSRNATNAGLYHYTMLTNQVKETNTTVDIGFHYVATDANGTPLDYDGDGIPDYWEDLNGNGSVDSGETDWRSSSDLGFRVMITRPRNASTIP